MFGGSEGRWTGVGVVERRAEIVKRAGLFCWDYSNAGVVGALI